MRRTKKVSSIVLIEEEKLLQDIKELRQIIFEKEQFHYQIYSQIDKINPQQIGWYGAWIDQELSRLILWDKSMLKNIDRIVKQIENVDSQANQLKKKGRLPQLALLRRSSVAKTFDTGAVLFSFSGFRGHLKSIKSFFEDQLETDKKVLEELRKASYAKAKGYLLLSWHHHASHYGMFLYRNFHFLIQRHEYMIRNLEAIAQKKISQLKKLKSMV